MTETVVKHGLGGALNWYRVLLTGIQAKDDEGRSIRDHSARWSLKL